MFAKWSSRKKRGGIGVKVFRRFKLQGNVAGAIRSDDEMEVIDKKVADSYYKDQKRKMDVFLQQKGFVKYKTNSYLRRNRLDVLEYIDLQYGGCMFNKNIKVERPEGTKIYHQRDCR